MNIYQMYYANDKQFGFYVQRKTWGYTIAKVTGIGGVTEGDDIPGAPPYFHNQAVAAEFYQTTNIDQCHQGNCIDVGEISCPGTFQYDLISEL